MQGPLYQGAFLIQVIDLLLLLLQDASQPEKLARGRPQQHSGQMHDVQRGIGAKGWAFLDLHGLSVPAAQLALQNVSRMSCNAAPVGKAYFCW